jgi:hypothetical protein
VDVQAEVRADRFHGERAAGGDRGRRRARRLRRLRLEGLPLRGERDIRRFFDDYNTLLLPSSGSPEAYTVVNGQVLVGPVGDGSTGQIVYQMSKPTLTADADPTGLPDGFDLALVFGARAVGYALNNAGAMAGEYEQMFDAQVAALANDWLDVVLETGGQSGAYRPGSRAFPAYR